MRDIAVIVEDQQPLAKVMVRALSGVIRSAKLPCDLVHVTNRKDALEALRLGQLGLVSLDSHIPPEFDAQSKQGEGFLLIDELRRWGYAGYVVLYAANPDALDQGRRTSIAGKPIIVIDKSHANAAQWVQCCKALLTPAPTPE